MPKNPAAVTLGRMGGRAKAASMTPDQRKAAMSNAARAYWAKLTPDQRKAELKRRAQKRKENAK